MSLLCTLEMHRWVRRKAALNPDRVVWRCERCARVKITKVAVDA